MRAVLGIDAAWTTTQPSGVALAVERSNGWRMIAAAASYQRFHAQADRRQPPEQRPSGSEPDAMALLLSASVLCGAPLDLVAIDMPLALTPIVGRRLADDEVSRAYGARKCGTHTPGAKRPGRLSDALREGFEDAGYPLLTKQTGAIKLPGVIEIYPHPALVELFDARKRLPYKASKVRSYWPEAIPADRRTRLYSQWREIAARLEREIAGVEAVLPPLEATAKASEIKAYEDTLDAIVCAWVAICALEGRAMPFGDENAAIWIPTSFSRSCKDRKSRQCIKSLCEAALARATPAAAGCVDDGRADRVLRLAPYSQKYDIEDVAFLARRPFVWSCLFRVRSFHGPASFLEGLPETVSGFAPDRPLNCGQSPPHEIAIPCRGAMPAPSLAFGERSAELRGAPSPVLHWKLATSSARRRIYFFPAVCWSTRSRGGMRRPWPVPPH